MQYFNTKDNINDDENKLIELEKILKKFKIENDILKQAAVLLEKK
ncbi:hypothetical protein [Peptostreptococcus faecalis]|nr:hypothetical protein [Peptostreptococcus faecalis]